MVFLPLPNSRRIFGVAKIILVGRFLQPTLLAGAFAHLATVGFGTETLPLPISICIEPSEFSLGSQTKGTTPPKIKRRREENPLGRKIRTAKKEEKLLVNCGNKTAAKKIHFESARIAPFPPRP